MRAAINLSLFWVSFLVVTAATLGAHLPPWVGTVMELPKMIGG